LDKIYFIELHTSIFKVSKVSNCLNLTNKALKEKDNFGTSFRGQPKDRIGTKGILNRSKYKIERKMICYNRSKMESKYNNPNDEVVLASKINLIELLLFEKLQS